MVRSLGETMWRFLKTQNHDVIKVDPPRKTESRALKRYANTHTHAHHGTVPCSQEWKRPKCPRTGKRINPTRAVPTVGDHPAFRSVLASIRPSVHTFIPALSARLSIHPAVTCLLAHSVSGHPLRGAGLRAPRCPPPHCRQLQVKAASGRSRKSPTPQREQVRLSEEAESAGGALLQADSSETQGGGCIRSEVLRHRAAAR